MFLDRGDIRIYGNFQAKAGSLKGERYITLPAGNKRWVIANGYIPPASSGTSRQLISHDAICILNSGDQEAHIYVTIFFADRDPIGPYKLMVGALRTKHFRFNELTDPAPVPHDTDYASIIESDVPVVVQHTRLNSRQRRLH